MGKTPETIAFVKEACVAYFTRDDMTDDERARLRIRIDWLVDGRESLTSSDTVDAWLERTHVPKQYATGALAPPDMKWQNGKTVATIAFVNEAEAMMLVAELNDAERRQLQARIWRLKRGDETLTESETFAEWLAQLRDHHP
jgi:hypothetical protein